MMDARIIKPGKDSEWISLMVMQDKKMGEIRICVDLSNMNDPSIHDPFMTPFTNEVLEVFEGQEIYSFRYGFLGYHQISIAKEDRHKTTFVTKWECFQYIMISFGLKNVPTVFSRIVVIVLKDFIHKFLAVYMDDWTIYVLVKYHTVNL